MIHKTNEELRQLKFINRLTSKTITELLNSKQGGPSLWTIRSWLRKPETNNYNQMPANSLELLKIRLKEAGYLEV